MRARISRRAFVRLSTLAGAGMLGGLSLACQQAPAPPPTAAPAKPTEAPKPSEAAKPATTPPPSGQAAPATTPLAAGESGLTIAVGAMPNGPDADNEQSLLASLVYNLFYDRLVEKDPTGATVPSLAESWSTSGPTTWTFKLRSGVQFHNGEPFNAAAVKYNLDRIRDPNAKLSNANRFAPVDQVDVVDDTTVRIETKQPFAHLLGTLVWLRIKPPKLFAEKPDDFARAPVGTGPYQVTEWTQNNRVVLKAARSWRPSPKIENIVIRHVPDDATRVAAVEAGEVDVAYAVPVEQVDRLKGRGLTVVSSPVGQSMVLPIRAVADSPLRDVKVRQAVAHAIDIDGIITGLIGGQAKKLEGQAAGPETFGHNPNVTAYPYDPARAKQLLTEAGQGGGFSVAFSTSVGRYIKDKEIAEAVASQLGEVGIKINLEPLESGVYLERLFSGKLAPMFLIGLTYAPDLDLDNTMRVATSGHPTDQWADPTFDELFKRISTELDQNARRRLMQEAVQYQRDQVNAIYLFQIPGIYGIGKRLTGATFRPDYGIELDKATLQ